LFNIILYDGDDDVGVGKCIPQLITVQTGDT